MTRRLLAAAFVLLVLWWHPGAAGAQGAGSERFQGTLRNEVVRDGVTERPPVGGVTITVERDGTEVGRAVTGADGKWQVPVEGPGHYRVTIDRATLPEGVGLRDPNTTSLEFDVNPGDVKGVVFALGAQAATPSAVEQLSSLFASGLVYGLEIAMCSVGLSLIFGVSRLLNFALGELVSLGAIVAWYLNTAGPRLTLVLAGAVAVLAGGVTGGALDVGLFRKLRKRGVGVVSMMVVSIGVSVALRHLYLIVFEGSPRAYRQYAVQSRLVHLGPVSLPPKQLWLMAIALMALVGTGLLLNRTRIGTAIRALSDEPDLAESSGIDADRVIAVVFVLAGALAALGGVMFGVTEAAQWDLGYGLILPMFAAVVLGGLGTAYGAMLGGLVVGLVQELSTFWFPTDFKLAFALGALAIILVTRPEGLLGVRERFG